LFLVVAIQLSSVAQETRTKINEVGITFSSLSSFGLRYKYGSPETLLRLTLLSLNGSSNNSKPDSLAQNNNSSLGFGFNIGFEKRKSITDKLGFYYGLDLLSKYGQSENKDIKYKDDSKSWSAGMGIALVLGLTYTINNNFILAAEVDPGIMYYYGKSKVTNSGIQQGETTNTSVSYGLNNYGANLTLAYRFGK
jgi:hypothetical protein